MNYKENASLGSYDDAVAGALSEMREERIVQRMLEGDHTVWGPEPEEIANRLGWLKSPENSGNALPEILDFAKTVRDEGIEHVQLLGMGGSSLAPEVFGFALESKEGYPSLAVLDSTDPEAVLDHAEGLDLSRTLFVVSTKSGGTVETFSFFKFFYNKVAEVVGKDQAGSHFVAITDPGSGLADTAEKYDFRKTFINDPNIGGRYSALSYFGIVPAALGGADVEKLLKSGHDAADELEASGEDDSGAWLGAVIGELARSEGRDKLTLLASPSLAAFGPWAEQLVAESTGKDGVGILPVAEEPEGSPDVYGNDRVFVSMRLRDEEDQGGFLDDLRNAGHPVIEVLLGDPYDLGGEMFRWEVATAVAGWRLGINPFDQPNVESAKIQARSMVDEYMEKGELPEPEPTVEEDGMVVYSAGEATGVQEALEEFLGQSRSGDYVSLQAYLPPSGGDDRSPARDARPVAGASEARYHLGLWAAFSALDGPAPQGRRWERTLHSVHRRSRRGGADTGRGGRKRCDAHLRGVGGGAGIRRPAGAVGRGSARDPLPPRRGRERRPEQARQWDLRSTIP